MIEISQHSLFKKHDFDTIFSDLYNLYKKNFWTLFITCFIASLALQLVLFISGYQNIGNWVQFEEYDKVPGNLATFIFLVIALALVIYSLIYSFITYYLLKKQEDENLKPLKAFGTSANKYLFKYLILTIIISLMIGIGAVLGIFILIIGSFLAALYLGTSVFISGTVLVAEDTGPFESINRSFALTHKDFWTSLGMVVVFIIILILINLILSAIIAIPGAIVFINKAFTADSFSDIFSPSGIFNLFNLGFISIFLTSLVNALILPLSPIFSILLYYRLRYIEKERSPNPPLNN